jgi:hypothetical protein
MADPPRLRSESGTLESLLLRSAPSFEPPPSAEEEVWRRLKIVGAVGASAGATGAATYAAASGGAKLASKAIWLTVLKWGAVVAIGVPAVGVATRAVLRREARSVVVEPSAPPVRQATRQELAAPPAEAPAPPAPMFAPPPASADVPASPPAKVAAAPRLVPRTPARAEATAADAPSALRAESLLLGAARARLAAGDPRAALDDVARLQAQFPRGRLVQEREVVAIDALAAIGRVEAGAGDVLRARANAFLQRFPASPYAAHVRQLIEP